MPPLSRILVASDLSAPSRHAVERGFRLAADQGAECAVVHAIALDAIDSLVALLGEGLTATKQQLEQAAQAGLQQQMEQARAARSVSGRPLNASGEVISGPPLAVILARAQALDAELLVLGAQGESFLRHALLGSTASRLLRRNCRQPMLVVKQMPHEAYQRLLISIDFSAASLPAIQIARRVAPTADIVLFHALDLPFEGKLTYAGVDQALILQYVTAEKDKCRQRLHDLAAQAGLTGAEYSTLILRGHPASQIVSQEQELDCDLIVLGKHGSHLSEELLLGSVTKHVLADSQCDVLMFAAPPPPAI